MSTTPFKLSNPAFLVEGHLEQRFLQTVCGKKYVVQRIGCNGDSVSMEAISKAVGTLARLLHKHNPIVVIFDREGRAASADQLINEFHKHIQNENINSQLIVGMPDRHIENWILADKESLAKHAGVDKSRLFENYEGTHGKKELKKLLPPELLYQETVHGVEWLKSSNSATIAANSDSFSKLLQQLDWLNCWWLPNFKLQEV